MSPEPSTSPLGHSVSDPSPYRRCGPECESDLRCSCGECNANCVCALGHEDAACPDAVLLWTHEGEAVDPL